MIGTIETPHVAKIVLSLLKTMFFEVILNLERESADQVVFGKQLAVRKCLKEIENFIFDRPYGIFNIEILDSLTRNKEDPILVLSFKNYTKKIPEKIPLEYHIILDETYTKFEAYQSSLDGILISLRL